jgi:hypothetical protein
MQKEMQDMGNIRNSIQAALNLMVEAKFVKAAEILFSVLAQPEEEDTDAIICIAYHEASIKRLEKRIEELQAALAISRSLSAPKFPEWNIKG